MEAQQEKERATVTPVKKELRSCSKSTHLVLIGITVISMCTLNTVNFRNLYDDYSRFLATALPSLSRHDDDPRFAYAYMISGCTETSCIGYVLNLVASAHVLHESNSTADIVLRVRMAANSPLEHLPPEQERWLNKSGVLLDYIPKVRKDNFGVATLEKFRVLEMIEYDRVLFLDSDIMPLCNMDYMFEESFREDGLLSEFVMLSGGVAPVTAACFLVTPQKGEFERVVDIVHRHRNKSLTFDPKIGWGHEIAQDDPWQAWYKKGTNWTFWAAASDQGILYHWIRYELLNYTWLDIAKMETWQQVDQDWSTKHPNSTAHKIRVNNKEDKYIAKVAGRQYVGPRNQFLRKHDLHGCGMPLYDRRDWASLTPFSDFYHFAGGQKPWKDPILSQDVKQNASEFETGRDVWLHALYKANVSLGLGLASNITLTIKGNPLGGGDPFERPHLLEPDLELPQPMT